MDKNAEFDPREMVIAKGDELAADRFPVLYNISAAFVFRFVPRPEQGKPPEFAYIPLFLERHVGSEGDYHLKARLTISQWNTVWEAGQVRAEFVPQVMGADFPEELGWLREKRDANLYLIPDDGGNRYTAFLPLYHLLPLSTLRRHGLPPLTRGLWPPSPFDPLLGELRADGFDERMAHAFASHVWPLLDSGSRMRAFSEDYPIKVLAHNLNFWLPFAVAVAENRLRGYSLVPFKDDEERRALRRLRRTLPSDVRAGRPRMGGSVWYGEGDAWEATKEMVEVADRRGRLREIIDAVRSNRVEDDFSERWSNAKEDFERKLYHKRAKVRVTFVELDGSVPVHAPTSELHDNLLWEDFFALLDPKERHIVVCLRNGETRLGDIAKGLGYTNHSAVTKALSRIRRKAIAYLRSSS